MPAHQAPYKNVLVLGGSYGGFRAATVLADELPPGYRVFMVERQSHFNHLYVFPRYCVVPGHEHKAYIPYAKLKTFSGTVETVSQTSSVTPVFMIPAVEDAEYEEDLFLSPPPSPLDFGGPHRVLHASVETIHPSHVTLSRAFPEHGLSEDIPYDFLVYALGNILPEPLVMPPAAFQKIDGVAFMVDKQARMSRARNVVIAGGGALGIQFAADLAEYRKIHVTLVHSRSHLLPRFDLKMHDHIIVHLTGLGVEVILNDKVDSTVIKDGRVVTRNGKKIECDLLMLCTGLSPNTALLTSSFAGSCVQPNSGLITVSRTMQFRRFTASSFSDPGKDSNTSTYPNMFAIGDVADAFGAIKSGRAACCQAEVAARNVILLVKKAMGLELEAALLDYKPGPPSIKLTVGLRKILVQSGVDILEEACSEDLDAAAFWQSVGADPTDMWT